MDSTLPAVKVSVLILEDVATDAELLVWTLTKSGLVVTPKVVATRGALIAALDESRPDIFLTDFKLPDFDGLSAIKIAREKYPDLPIIVVTGALGDEAAVELIKAGAVDYVLKDRLARLPAAVQKALLEAEKATELRHQTAVAHAEKDRFSMVAEGSNDAIVMTNGAGFITFWNRSAERVFGYSEIEVMGRDLHGVLAPESERRWARERLPEFSTTGRGPIVGRTREVTAERKNGTQVRVELSISAIHMDDQWIAIGLARDVSERPKLIRIE